MKFFSYDSKFSQAVLKLCNCCYLNLLWFICSIPLVTVGASTTALYTVTLKIAKGEDVAVTSAFFRAFRENFRQSTVLWLILLAAGICLAGDGYILSHLRSTTTGAPAIIWTLMLALVLVAGIAYGIVLLYVFPLVASVVNTNWSMLKNAFFIGTHYLFCTILVFGIHLLIFFVTVRFFTPLLIFGEGLCALLSSYLLAKVIGACTYDPHQAQSASYMGEHEEFL